MQRLSGGNQQKVTIARWIAAGARTILCFDPTRGIDIRTKREIYRLLRELAAQGTSVLLYTSELEEVQLVCDRAVVIFGGRVVDVAAGRDRRRGGADARRLRLAARAQLESLGAGPAPRKSAAHPREREHAVIADGPARGLGARPVRAVRPASRRHQDHPARTTALPASDRSSAPRCPSRSPSAAQTVVVIAGGIDLSIASMMALTSVTAAVLMDGASEEFALLVVPLVLLLGLALGAINGALIVITRVPDIVVTLSMLFVWQGAALLVLEAPGGGAAKWLMEIIVGTVPIPGVPTEITRFIPKALVAPRRLPRR